MHNKTAIEKQLLPISMSLNCYSASIIGTIPLMVSVY